ncbi:hypothetical protein GWK47_015268 [Chionoecetes opilio]|uniref:Uncharacterized protein n=1 Tax=Chionoecetes opilio TaxID=41210 RepID=A0A8J5CN14_CHIOP|nr:hypothetical protein GWK47_015268 [Chionoecetes opilio]
MGPTELPPTLLNNRDTLLQEWDASGFNHKPTRRTTYKELAGALQSSLLVRGRCPEGEGSGDAGRHAPRVPTYAAKNLRCSPPNWGSFCSPRELSQPPWFTFFVAVRST